MLVGVRSTSRVLFIFLMIYESEKKVLCNFHEKKKQQQQQQKKHSNCKILKYVRHHLYEIGSGSLLN